MKKLTCADIGGPCNAPITGSSSKEMMDIWTNHMERAHPEIADEMKMMSPEERAEWEEDLEKKWNETEDE